MSHRPSPTWRCLFSFTLLLALLGSGDLLAPREAAAASGGTALGGVWAWGSDSDGQLGNGVAVTANQPAPAALAGVTGITAIAAGLNHSLALKADGTVVAWGDDSAGQLGNGATVTADQPAPVQVVGVGGGGLLTNVVAIAAGTAHSLALRSDGTVVAWGADFAGQLGNGATVTANQPAPVQVIGAGGTGVLTNVTAIAAGYGHSLALRSDGTVFTWGRDTFGQLGNGAASAADQPAPVPVVVVGNGGLLRGIVAIAAGSYHSLALRSDGTVVAWGRDGSGQLGNGTAIVADQPAPTNVAGLGGDGTLRNVTALVAGQFHSLALRSDGTVVAWGADYNGQLGNGASSSANQPAPVLVAGGASGGTLSGVSAIATGASHALALKSDGTIVAWGTDSSGQLGNGATATANQPAPFGIKNPAGVTAISAGGGHSLALQGGAVAGAWGSDDHGQLGDGTVGNPTRQPLPQPITGLITPPAVALATGTFRSLALRSDGTVVEWGEGSPDQPAPVSVAGVGGVGSLGNVVAIAAGNSHRLALRSDGTVVAWGGELSGQLGNGGPLNDITPTPVLVVGVGGTGTLTNVVAIAAGSYYSLALRSDGTVVAWGSDTAGTLGNGSVVTAHQPAPVVVANVGGSGMLTNVVAIAAGHAHSLALRSDGTVIAWGNNFYGQLGNGDTFFPQSAPIVVVDVGGGGALGNVVALAAGVNHSLALRGDGTVVAWGSDTFGQLGNGPAVTADQPTPVQVVGVGGGGNLGNVVAIAAGHAHSLALRSDGTFVAWGADSDGQGGISASPLLVVGVSGGAALAGNGNTFHRLILAQQIGAP